MKTALYNVTGEKKGEIELSDAVFGVSPKIPVVHQVFTALMANRRQVLAHTKDRSDVRGGGRKPWRQKGTGRARHGSTRSPIWTGGGVTFGPRNDRNFKQKINRKMNRLAVRMCLSDKVAEEKFVVLNEYPSDGKTATLSALVMKLPMGSRSTVLLTDSNQDELLRASRNVQGLDVQRAQDVNVADLLNHQYVIASEQVVRVLEERLA